MTDNEKQKLKALLDRSLQAWMDRDTEYPSCWANLYMKVEPPPTNSNEEE
nr:hypothetical protein 29 [Balneolaceae bacterium]